MSFTDVLAEELAFEKWQFEKRSGAYASRDLGDSYLEVDCLVHEDWLKGATSSDQSLPRCTPPFSKEEVHWMLQPSCGSVPSHPWQRTHICCFKKPEAASLKHSCRRLLVPQSVPNIDNIHAFLTAVAHESTLASWRDFERRLDETNSRGEDKMEEEEEGKEGDRAKEQRPSSTTLTPFFMSQLVKVLYNKTMRPLLVLNPDENKDTPTQPVPSLSSLNDPSLIPNTAQPKASGQENLSPLMAALESSSAYYLIYKYHRFTLLDCILHSSAMLDGSAKPLFVVYQLLKLLSYCHSKGLTLGGDLSLNNTYIDSRLWIQYYIPPTAITTRLSAPPISGQEEVCTGNSTPTKEESEESPPLESCLNGVPSVSEENVEDYTFPPLSLIDSVTKWRSGELSNFKYLMLLNYHAGRCLGDPNNHPIFPWVTDFTYKNGNLRNLSCSKHRLAKGDTQLDFTFSSANEMFRRSGSAIGNVVPHHVGDIASDVTYYVYKARQTTKDVLCSRVRPHWVPEQYPVSIEKMYTWTPDECIPEFYTSPDIFYSIHPDLPDLQVPDWCSNPEEFIQVHRNLLESDQVSANLHHWIDLTFGYKLSGEAAIKAKNVYLSLVDSHTHPCSSGIVQLFRSAHPKRLQNSSAPIVISQWQRYLATSSLMNLTTFDIPQIRNKQSRHGNDINEEEGKSFTTLLHEHSYNRSPDMRGIRTGIDDGSFEHVPYPQELDDQMLVDMTPDASLYPGNLFYDTGMLNRQNKGPVGRQQLEVVNSAADQAVKQGILRGILRPKRPQPVDTGNETFDWQMGGINFPQESHPLQPLTQLEELSHFLNKSCNGYGQMFERTWHPDDLLMLQNGDSSLSHKILNLLRLQEEGHSLSYEDRVLLDITAVVCVSMEITANKYLRACLPVQGSLSDRYSSIRRLVYNGRLIAPYCLRSLTQLVFIDKPDPSVRVLDILPYLSPAFLIQQFIPVFSFPEYFDTLYNTLSELETRSLSVGLSLPPVKLRLQKYSVLTEKEGIGDVSGVIGFMSECCKTLLPQLDMEGQQLLMLYILPLFEHPRSSFEAALTLFEPVSSCLGSKWVQQSLILPFLNLYDNYSNPGHRYSLLGRGMAEKLITHFSLSVFLSRFISCFIDAVIEPMGHGMKQQQTQSPKRGFEDHLLKEESGRHKMNLAHTSIILSPAGSNTASAGHSLTFSTWAEPQDIHSDEEDSDAEGDFSFPVVSLFEAKLPSTPLLFGLQDDTDQPNTHSDLPDLANYATGDTKSPFSKKDYSVPSLNKESGTESPRKSSLPQQQSCHKEADDDELEEALPGIAPLPAAVHTTPPTTLPIPPPPTSTSSSSASSFLPPPTQSAAEDNGDTGAMSTVEEPLLPPTNMEESSLPLMTVTAGIPLTPETTSREASIDEPEEGEPQEEIEREAVPEESVDPQIVAMSRHISEVASDCLIWLLWRLGPILATKYITRPLLDNLHRCFTGVHKSKHAQPGVHSVLEVLGSFIQYYGEQTITHFFVPFIKQQVSNLIKKSIITVKAEAGIATSIAILELVIKKTRSSETLLGLMEDLCLSYFQPLFILLCSKNHVFPSGSLARVTVCNSAVQLMRSACDKLGSSRSSEVCLEALKCFFNCYSLVHGSGNALIPIEGHFGHNGAPGSPRDDRTDSPETLNLTAIDQVLETFSASLVHETYVHFCKLIGQIQLRKHLQDNIDVIEDLHVSYSQKKTQGSTEYLPSLLGLMEKELTDSTSSSSSSGSSDSSQSNLDLAYHLGPFQAFQGKSGLGRDSAGFGGPSWFVEVEKNESEEPPTINANAPNVTQSGLISSHHSVGRSPGTKPALQVAPGGKTQSEGSGGGASQVVQNPTNPEGQSGTLDRGSALFEAKFRPHVGHLSDVDGPKDELDILEADCTLVGEWTKHWSNQCAYQANTFGSYDHFEGTKLQTYNGHKSAIRSICVLDSEHLFVSGSKDKTVKIWSLHNRGAGSIPPRLTYLHHQKPILKVDVINGHRNVLSCDGSVHLWDVETGYCIHQFTPPRLTTQFLAMDPLPDSPSQVLVATSDFNLKFIDIRTKTFQHSWRTSFPTGGSIRFLSSHGTWTAAGNINGSINVLDLRTGELTYNWKPALPQSGWGENLVHLRTTPRGNILTSMGAGLISLWKPNSKLLNHFRGHNANTPCLEMFGDQLVAISTNGSVMVHGSFEYVRDNVVSSCRLRMRGNLSCSAALQLNQLLLLGNDYGQIILMA